ncbi:NUDIX hydrolase [Euzebya sp.]|uniref:NUDIX hydrolase n=1 Tax=Euzebya sp. TaxID=1971409 RepID=UPI003511F34C
MPDPRRAVVRQHVASLDPVDAREAASIDEVLAGLDDLRAPFDRGDEPAHVTGSALVLGERGIVLLHHRRLGLWVQPGGHVDPGEWPHEAALREGEEETGLVLRHPDGGPLLLHVDAHDGCPGRRHLDLRYVLWSDGADPTPPPGESQACHWFGWSAAADIADPGLRGVLSRARAVAAAGAHAP